MYFNQNIFKIFSQRFGYHWIWLLPLFLWVITLSGCISLKAGKYLNDARDYAQNPHYRQKALQYYQKAWNLYFRKEESPQNLRADILHEMGNLCYTLQEYETALKYYDQFRSMFPEQSHRQREIVTNSGVIYRYLGRYEEALEYFAEAQKIFEQLGPINPADPGKDYILNQLNLAVTLIKAERIPEARSILEKILPLLKNTKDYQYESALAQAIRGIIEAEQGNFPLALEDHQNALSIFETLQRPYDQTFSYHNIGLLYALDGKYEDALKFYTKSITLCQDIGDLETKWLAHYNLGNLLRDHADIENARKNYQEAIDIIESIRLKLRIDDFKTSFIEDKIKVYKALIDLSWEEGDREAAFDYLERAKSRALVDLLSNQRIELSRGIDRRLLKEKKRIDEKIRSILEKLEEENAKPVEQRTRMVHLTQDLQQARKDYQEFLRKVQRERFDEYASLIGANPYNFKAIQKFITDRTAFLEYVVLGDRLLIFVLTSKRELYIEKIEEKDFQKKLQGTVLAFRIDLAREIPGWQEKSQWLYSKLIAPVEQYLREQGIRTLCIIPYGILHYLPFGALQSESNEFLLEQYDIFYAPSSTVLKFALEKGEKRPITQLDQDNTHNQLLMLANPDNTLGYAEEEVRAIQMLYPQQETQLLIGSEVTEENVKAEAGNYRILHFATHGILDPAQPLFSGLVLANNEFLEVHEIFNELSLDNNSLVVLSACNTALGRRSEGDEIIGLSRAFMYAGAPSIIASLWAVDDQSTALIMQRFYKYLKEGSYTKTTALKASQISLLYDTEYPEFHHPHYWAAFEVIGSDR